MKNHTPIEEGLSPHLFWDIPKDTLDWERNAALIIKRVLEYGLWEDWKIIDKKYGIEFIAQEVKTLRELEPKALNFIACLAHQPLSAFRCYTTTPSKNPHWNF
jgi:hypothetical protein